MKIHKQQLPLNKISWPELYFMAEASQEPFQEITVTFVEDEEYVKVEDSNIRVCVKMTPNEEDVMWKALDMVADALDKLDGHSGVIYFNTPIQLTTPNSVCEYLH